MRNTDTRNFNRLQREASSHELACDNQPCLEAVHLSEKQYSLLNSLAISPKLCVFNVLADNCQTLGRMRGGGHTLLDNDIRGSDRATESTSVVVTEVCDTVGAGTQR